MSRNQEGIPSTKAQWFATTHWTVVLSAKAGDPQAAAEALETLCRAYWPPIYAYLRRQDFGPEDAKDLTQEFLSRLVHKEWLSHLEDRRGKFRSFLLTFLKHFLSDQRDRDRAQKRGDGRPLISLDAWQEEEREDLEPGDGRTADQIYELRWAQTVMAEAARRLAEVYRQRGKSAVFEQIKDLHPGKHGERSYTQIGAALGITEQAVKNAVHTLRRRYREMVRKVIAQTVADPKAVNEEMQHLKRLFDPK